MKLINQSAQYLPQGTGIDGIYKQVELAGRTSYLSWDKMTDNSAKKFVDMLIKSKHTSVLEHGTVYLKMYHEGLFAQIEPKHTGRDYFVNPYSKCVEKYDLESLEYGGTGYYITTNLRVLQENGWLKDLQYLCEPTEFHEKRLSVKVVTSRSISHELVRHRSMSFIQESQRYVGYDKNRFGGEITYIIPSWLKFCVSQDYYGHQIDGMFIINPEQYESLIEGSQSGADFLGSLENAEKIYIRLIQEYNLKPQEAREVLPNATKTTLVITAFESDWREWFAQRLFGKTGQPHPDMLVLANLIKEEFEKAGVWEGIMKYQSKYD